MDLMAITSSARLCAWARALGVAGLLGCAGGGANAAWSHSIVYLGETPSTLSFEQSLSANIGAALDLWTEHLAGGASLEIEIVLTDAVQRAAGHSVTSGLVGQMGAVEVYEQGVAFEIRTGTDPNGAQPDLRILLNTAYLEHELWLDPQPTQRQAAVPLDRVDAVSVFAHELGHALAFNGWGSEYGGGNFVPYASTWDTHTAFDGTGLSFIGAAAMQVYGGPVPVTLGNNWHVGRDSGPGADLLDDLMNGVSLQRGRRYDVSALDRAMLSDMGLMLSPAPEPQGVVLALAGLGVLAVLRRRRASAAVGRADN